MPPYQDKRKTHRPKTGRSNLDNLAGPDRQPREKVVETEGAFELNESNARAYLGSKIEEQKVRWLIAYDKYRVIYKACLEIGISPQTVSRWRKDDPLFEEAFAVTDDKITELLEDTGMDRALKSSDTLLMFFLRARRKDKYADVKEIKGVLETNPALANTLKKYGDKDLAKLLEALREV